MLIDDVTPRGLDIGSFSSGHVADPLELVSTGNSWRTEKPVDDKNGSELSELSCRLLDFKPGQVMATEASAEKNSHDLTTFGCKNADSL